MALNIRDECCRFPGCCNHKHIHFHHLEHWSNLGETEPDNMIKLCTKHHALLHAGHYNIELSPDEPHKRWLFKTPSGKVIEEYAQQSNIKRSNQSEMLHF